MSLIDIYKNIYQYEVTITDDCLLVSFTGDKIDFVIKEIFNNNVLSNEEVDKQFELVTDIADTYLCNEKRLLVHGGWEINKSTNPNLTDNPYQLEGKTIYTPEYKESLANGKHIELFAHNEYAYSIIKPKLDELKIGAVVQATGTGKTYLISRRISEINPLDKILIIAPTTFILEQLQKTLSNRYNIEYMTFAMLGTLLSDKKRFNELKYKHIFIDEAHHSASEVWGKALELLLNNNPDAFVLGTSATPVRPSDSINVVNSFFKDNLFYEFNLSSAIIHQVLPKPLIIQSIYNIEEIINEYESRLISTKINKEREKDIREHISALKIALNSADVTNIIKKHIPLDRERFFVFCANKEELNEMKPIVENWFLNAGFSHVKSYIVHSDISSKKNQRSIEKFEGEYDGMQLLFSIDMLSEGLHIDSADGAMFLRKTASYIVALQQLGRTLNAGKDKQPIVLDLVNNINNAITYESVIGKPLFPDSQCISEGKRKEFLNFTLTDKVIDNFTEYIKELENLWNKYEITWENQFEELQQYLKKNNKYPKNNTKLGIWVSTQRGSYKKNELSQERIDKLNSINFIWVAVFEAWDSNFTELKNYIKKNNEYPKQNSLDGWVGTQRVSYNKGELSQERIERLNSINFIWDARAEAWDSNFTELKNYIKKNNEYPKQNTVLGRWVGTQRGSYKKNELSQEYIDKLNSINFIWDAVSKTWENSFTELKNYIKKNNEYPKNNTKLNTWVRTQRTNYNKGELSQEYIDKLNSINFIWNIISEVWDSNFTELKNYIKKNNEYPKHNTALGNWLRFQRVSYKKNELSQEQIDKLNSINFVWDILGETWDSNFTELKNYIKKNNEYPKQKKTPLNSWVTSQRYNCRKGKLSQERIDKLNSINFIWNIISEAWDSNFTELKNYIKKNNEYPKHNTVLGRWVTSQRFLYKGNELSQEQIDKLNSINIIWDILGETWQNTFEKLQQYLNKHKKEYPKNNTKLNTWVRIQRSNYNKGILSQERIDKLNSINFIWNIISEAWENSFEELKNYIGENNEYPKHYTALGRWVTSQRGSYKKNELSQEYIDKLSSINFIWDARAEAWQKNFKELKEYLQNNNGEYPKKGNVLYGWMVNQTKRKINNLTQEQIDKLNSINISVK